MNGKMDARPTQEEFHVSTVVDEDAGNRTHRSRERRRVFAVIVGIETGGTKVLCAISDPADAQNPIRVERFPTGTPAETFARINTLLHETVSDSSISALGIASFGPLTTDPADEHYGWITGTTKPGWAFTDVFGHLDLPRSIPRAIVTDVTGSAIGEARWGAAMGTTRVAYATVGTGIGVGFVDGERILGGNGYPEMGNILVRRHPLDDFAGVCPYHGDCVEGLASGPAIIARWGASGSELSPVDREAMNDIIGFYVAQLLSIVTYTLGAERVVLGGGVMHTPALLDSVRWHFDRIVGGPLAGHGLNSSAAEFIVAPQLGERSGVLGAVTIAERALSKARYPAVREA